MTFVKAANSRKTANLLVIAALFLFLPACKGGMLGTSPERALQTGNEGVSAAFLKNAPPETISENSFFKIILDMENKGVSDVAGGFISITANERYLFLETGPILPFQLKGKEFDYGAGDKIFVEFDAVSREIAEEVSTPITATWCYPYETRGFANVCVDTDIYERRLAKKACTMGTVSLSGGQGGPLSVTRIEPASIPAGEGKIIPEFKMYFENAGTGVIVNNERLREACSFVAEYDENNPLFNVFSVRAYMGDIPLNCGEKSVVEYRRGKTYITCRGPALETARGAFTTPIRADLEYGYRQTLKKHVTIEKLPNFK